MTYYVSMKVTGRNSESNVLGFEIGFIHIPVEAGVAAVRIGVLDWLLAP
jgi:hypothetical protein